MLPGFQIWNLYPPNLEIRPSKFGDSPYGHFPNLEGINSKFGNLATSRHPPQICPNLFSKVVEKSDSIQVFGKPKTSSTTFSTTAPGNFSTFPENSMPPRRKTLSRHF
jgi:hypothetical protein